MAADFSKIENIVIVLQENHTFDNYFGTYPNANGTLGKNICIPQSKGASTCLAPYKSATSRPPEMNHNWNSAHEDYDGGKMDGFVYSEGNKGTMSYFDRSQISRYWKAADSYVLCDNYFTSVMSESAPNHLFLVAGTAGGLKNDNVPSTLKFPPVFKELDQKGISWKVYGFTDWYEKFEYVQNSSAAKKNFVKGEQFMNDVENSNLSQVSWIIGAPGGSEHPPQDIQKGESSVADDIVNTLGGSKYWSSCAIFVTWDDYGGFYDHVPPPQIDAYGYGFRVPCLIISPYSKKGFIDSETYDHTSILKVLESRFALQPLSTRDSAAKDMSAGFDFNSNAKKFQPI